jgi:predicted RNA-binding protein with PIN domain
LDGYNVIHRIPAALDQAKLEERRWYLIRFIEQQRPQGSRNNRVTVVFDGNADVYGGMNSALAKIVFSQNGSADDEIRKIVGQARNPKEIIVVSDDREVQYAVRSLGAKIMEVRDFLSKGNSSRESQTLGGPSGKERLTDQEKHITHQDESRITSEFSRIWLDPKRKRKQ